MVWKHLVEMNQAQGLTVWEVWAHCRAIARESMAVVGVNAPVKEIQAWSGVQLGMSGSVRFLLSENLVGSGGPSDKREFLWVVSGSSMQTLLLDDWRGQFLGSLATRRFFECLEDPDVPLSEFEPFLLQILLEGNNQLEDEFRVGLLARWILTTLIKQGEALIEYWGPALPYRPT
ncbi:MAG: hypothetical protein WD850_01315 [Candidatus Spechtbacterales bacterium]